MEAPILGGFLQLVLPDHIRQIPKITDQKPNPGKNPMPETPVDRLPYSGLIVDAQGLEFEPILYPTIVGEQGKEIYSSLFVSKNQFHTIAGSGPTHVCFQLCFEKQLICHGRRGFSLQHQ